MAPAVAGHPSLLMSALDPVGWEVRRPTGEDVHPGAGRVWWVVFGVDIAVVRISESTPAPVFKLIAQPNDWEKTVRAATSHLEGGGVREELYRSFWAQWLKRVQSERSGWLRAIQPPAASWFSMTAGTPGATFYTSFTR